MTRGFDDCLAITLKLSCVNHISSNLSINIHIQEPVTIEDRAKDGGEEFFTE